MMVWLGLATRSNESVPVWRAPEGPEGLAAVPVGGGGTWLGFEATRRAKLAARTARGRAAAHGAARPHGRAIWRPEQQGAMNGPTGCRAESGREKSGRQSGRGSVTERVEIE